MTENPRWPDDHPARTHCWRCGKRITSGERYHALTVPFGPVFGIEHEACPPVDSCPCCGGPAVVVGHHDARPLVHCDRCMTPLPDERASDITAPTSFEPIRETVRRQMEGGNPGSGPYMGR